MRFSDWSSDVCSSYLWQGVQSRRDEQSGPAVTARLHDHDGGLHLLLRERAALSGRSDRPTRYRAEADRGDHRNAFRRPRAPVAGLRPLRCARVDAGDDRSEEHTSELQSLMRNSYAVFCLKKILIRTKKN